MILKKLNKIIVKIKEDIEKIVDLIPEDKQKVIKQLIIDAALAYGRNEINKAMKDE